MTGLELWDDLDEAERTKYEERAQAVGKDAEAADADAGLMQYVSLPLIEHYDNPDNVAGKSKTSRRNSVRSRVGSGVAAMAHL